ncbi:MAG: hypothetical protein HQM08_09145 [Candidatus Riflebacteria bacterium]|nr:hypothetical protein [Candidatus Riflebacteria bacterium]
MIFRKKWPLKRIVLSAFSNLGIVTDIIAKNPQVFMWVSGHLHLSPNNPAAYDPMNLFLGRVQVINNCDLMGKAVWTASFPI